MDKFKQLIETARAKRDAAIQKAREDYRSTVQQIKAIQATLEPRNSSLKGRPKPAVPLRAKIYDAIPKDSHFTVLDVANWMELEHADHQIIRTTLDRMIKRGEVKRVRRGRSRTPAVFAVSEYGPPVAKCDDLTMVQFAELVLREIGRPMSIVSLVVEMLERGYDAKSGEAVMLKSLRDGMRKKPVFIENSGLWLVV